jgi:transketolase
VSFIARCAARRRAHAADEDAGSAAAASAHDGDDVAIVACGITVDEAVRAAETLAATGSRRACSTATRSSRSTPTPSARRRASAAPIVTVEDHWPEGGLGDAVLEALADAPTRRR